jgi:hypothetical protein
MLLTTIDLANMLSIFTHISTLREVFPLYLGFTCSATYNNQDLAIDSKSFTITLQGKQPRTNPPRRLISNKLISYSARRMLGCYYINNILGLAITPPREGCDGVTLTFLVCFY